MFVKNKMTTNPYTISPDQTIPDAHELMTKHNIRRLPVVKDGKLVGVVSNIDISRSSPSKATSLSINELTYILSKTKISKVMTKNPITISPNALLEEAAIMMRDNGVSFPPVVENGKLVGIITESDIFDSFIELMGFREKGTRLTIEVEDEPGIMSHLAGIFAIHGANITNVAVYRGINGKSAIVVGINSQDTTEIEKEIENHGYKIIYKLQNK